MAKHQIGELKDITVEDGQGVPSPSDLTPPFQVIQLCDSSVAEPQKPPIDHTSDKPYPSTQYKPTFVHLAQVDKVNELTYSDPLPEAWTNLITQQQYDLVLNRCRQLRRVAPSPCYTSNIFVTSFTVITFLIIGSIALVGFAGGITMISFGVRALRRPSTYKAQAVLLGVGITVSAVCLVFSGMVLIFFGVCQKLRKQSELDREYSYERYLDEIHLYYSSNNVVIKGTHWPGTNKIALLFEYYQLGIPQKLYDEYKSLSDILTV